MELDRSWITYKPKTYTSIINNYAVITHVSGMGTVDPLSLPGLIDLINVFRDMKSSKKEVSGEQVYAVYTILDKTHICIVDLLDIKTNKRFTHKIQYWNNY